MRGEISRCKRISACIAQYSINLTHFRRYLATTNVCEPRVAANPRSMETKYPPPRGVPSCETQHVEMRPGRSAHLASLCHEPQGQTNQLAPARCQPRNCRLGMSVCRRYSQVSWQCQQSLSPGRLLALVGSGIAVNSIECRLCEGLAPVQPLQVAHPIRRHMQDTSRPGSSAVLLQQVQSALRYVTNPVRDCCP